jgi:Secretory lipase
MGGLTPNVTSVALSVNDKADAGLVAAGILGIAAAYPNISSVINSSFVSSAKQQQFYDIKSECITQIGTSDADMDILGYFKQGAGILSDSQYAFAVQDGGIMGIHGTPLPSNKLYFYKSTLDEISPIADTDALFTKYCSQGVTIQYVRDAYGDHSEEAVNGGLGALEFLGRIFGGTFTQTGCTEETVNSARSVLSSTSIPPTTPPASVTGSVTTSASASATGTSSAATTAVSIVGSSAAVTMAPQMIVLGVVGGVAALVM